MIALKKSHIKSNEHGAITIITALILTVLIGFTALSVDLGLHYYMGAKLQNAVDAAGTALAANLGAVDGSLEDIACDYLAKNGYDIDGKYKDKMTVTIEKKGVRNAETINADEYITTGYYKLTVDLVDNTLFAKVLDIDSLRLSKTAYIRCEANYVGVPRALKYTLFAGSDKVLTNGAALNINGRTSGTLNTITASFEKLINKTNEIIVQPILGIFGKDPNFNSLVNINLSEVITNGDVHSNSDINIAVQALNASRVKDQDYEGNSNDDAYDEASKENDSAYDDYGQVTYTAHNNIKFSSSLKNNHDESTHVYIQNQQYLEQTQVALYILDTVNFNLVGSTSALQDKYREAAVVYFSNNTQYSDNQKNAILAQADNLVYNNDGTYTLNNQSMIVYDVSQSNSEKMLADVRKNGIESIAEKIQVNGSDPLYGTSGALLYQNRADKASTINYGIKFEKKDDDGTVTQTKNLSVFGNQVNRDTSNIFAGVGGSQMNDATNAGAAFSVGRTFQEMSEYIAVPNMKPYFTRQVNQSIRNATKSAAELGDSQVTGARTVKEAVKNMTNDLVNILKDTEYTDFAYDSTDKLTNADFTPLFANFKESKDAGLTPLVDDTHTSYKGFNLFNGSNVLKTPDEFVSEFNSAFIQNKKTAVYGESAINQYYEENVASNDKYDTNYADGAVAKKRDELEKNFKNGYSSVKSDVVSASGGSIEMPKMNDNFLGQYAATNSVRRYFDYQVSDIDGKNITTTYMPYIWSGKYVLRQGTTWGDGTTENKALDVISIHNTSNSSTALGPNVNNVVDGTAYVSKKNLDVKANSSLVVNGNIDIAGTSQGELQLRTGTVIYCNGNITCNGLIMESGARLYCTGTITVKSYITTADDNSNVIVCNNLTFNAGESTKFINNAQLLIKGDFYCNGNIDNNNVIKCMGDVTINGNRSYKDGLITKYRNLGLYNYGAMYVKGNITAKRGLKIDNGELYVVGNISAANSGDDGSDILDLANAATVYVRGVVTSSRSNRHLWLETEGTGAVLSIYGYGGSNCFNSQVKKFANEQKGSTVYIAGGKDDNLLTGYNSETLAMYIPNSDDFLNAGTLYVYGKVQTVSSNIKLYNDGKTYINGNLYSNNANVSVTNGHSLSVSGTLTCNSAIFNGKSANDSHIYSSASVSDTISVLNNHKLIINGAVSVNRINAESGGYVWCVGSTSVYSVKIDSSDENNVSQVFLGDGSVLNNGSILEINGEFYLPNVDSLSLNNLDIGRFGTFNFYGKQLTVNDYFHVRNGGTLYVAGKTVINNCRITNEGNMYLMSGLEMSASTSLQTTDDIIFGSGSDTFIGNNGKTDSYNNKYGILSFKGYLFGRGNIYIENNLEINGYNKTKDEDNYVDNRWEGIIVDRNSNVYVSGDAKIVGNNYATYVFDSGSFSCNSFSVDSTIENAGKLIVLGNLDYRNDGEFSNSSKVDASSLKAGLSLLNGGKDGDVHSDAELYIGGTNPITIGGGSVNYGKMYVNTSLNVQGYQKYGDLSVDMAFRNCDYAVAHFNGPVNLNSNAVFNGITSVFSCVGDLYYGACLYNIGEFIATGDIRQNVNSVNNWTWRNGSSMSVMNGFYQIKGREFPDAVLYCGGTLQLGSNETAGEAGSFFNMATAYVANDLLVYCNKANSYFVTAFWGYTNSNTFVGNNFFAGGGVATGNDSIFMVGNDYRSKRSTKINIDMFTYNTITEGDFYSYRDRDNYKRCYFYVGGNMLVNTLGASVRADTIFTSAIPENNSRDMDVYSNSNIYVGGSLYCNCKLYMKQNAALVVAGDKSLYDENGKVLQQIFDSSINGTIKQTIQSLLDGTNYKIFIYQCLDENICSKIICGGSMFVKDTSKIRDMTKNWIYGDFKCNNYVEIGKSLLDDDRDESQATSAPYRLDGENKIDYVFANAGYTYVGGDFDCSKYNKVYASTTLRVAGDYYTGNYLTLRHDAKIYVGKKLTATTSIDGGTYSEFHVAGSMQATTKTIKLRDGVTSVVGGNMTALSYIELGKAGGDNYVRTVTKNSDGTYTVTESDVHGTTEGTEDNYKDDKGDGDKSEGENTGSGSEAGGDNPGGEEAIKDTTTIDTSNELASDSSDTATGGEFYVGKALVSYTSYIKEFAYSRVAVGNYVFTPKYLTLRHNSDLWVMPETFNNDTFVKKSYVSESDGTILGNIIDKIKEFNFNVSQTFALKNGSIYTLGELTLNKNASLMGTYDTVALGQCVLRQNSLIYMGHNFSCSAHSVNISLDSIKGKTSVVGFDSYGTVGENGTAFPVVVYADNEINISTTVDMKLTYLVSNRGDVNLYDIYSKSDNAENNAKQLPNAVCSYQKNVNYFAMYGKIGALFYSPNGNINLDGYYMEIWGSCVGNTIDINTYYLSLHRFTNWRTMQLDIAESGNVYLVSQKEYEAAEDNVDDIYMFNPNDKDSPYSEEVRNFF